MRKNNEAIRLSHCIVCGMRLSLLTGSGDIVWHRCCVDDSGIFCLSCRRQTHVAGETSHADQATFGIEVKV